MNAMGRRILWGAAVLLMPTLLSGEASAAEKIKISVIVALEGTYTILGEDSLRGFRLALQEVHGRAGGADIEVTIGGTNSTPDSAMRVVRKAVEQDQVDIVIGPLSGSEGIALRDYSKTQPQATFINGSSGAQQTTLVNPSENFFRFNMDGAQWMAGLGNYVFHEKGYKTVATLGEDYSFMYTQVFGFALEYCAAGGEITERLWVPLGTKDFGSIIAALPDDVDAIYLGLGGGDAINFLNQYQQTDGDAALIGSTIMIDRSVLSSKGRAKEALIGTPGAGPQADSWDDPNWQRFVKTYQDAFPPEQRFPGPSLLATSYYNAATAVFGCLDKIDGDLSDGHRALRQCLSTTELDAPNGKIRLDGNRQAIGDNYLTEVVEEDGELVNRLVKIIPQVNQTLGFPADRFAEIGVPGREVPVCKASY